MGEAVSIQYFVLVMKAKEGKKEYGVVWYGERGKGPGG